MNALVFFQFKRSNRHAGYHVLLIIFNMQQAEVEGVKVVAVKRLNVYIRVLRSHQSNVEDFETN